MKHMIPVKVVNTPGIDLKTTASFISYSKNKNNRALIIYPPHPKVPLVHLNELGFDEYIQKYADKVDLLDLTNFFWGAINCSNRETNILAEQIDWDFFIKWDNKVAIARWLLNLVQVKEIQKSISLIENLIPKDYDQYIFVLAFPKQTSIALCLAKYLKERGKRTILTANIKNSYLTNPVRLRDLMIYPFIDVVVNSFEHNIIDLISWKNLNEIEDIWYREQGEVKKNAAITEPIKLRHLSTPLYKHLEGKKVNRMFYELSRGCIKSCEYCSLADQALNIRPISTVIEDLKILVRRFDCHRFHFFSTAVNFTRKYVMELCQAMVANNLNIEWGSYIFYDAIDEEIAKSLHKAGCRFVDGGIESAVVGQLNSNKIRDLISLEENLAILKRNSIKTYVSFIIRGINYDENEEREIIDFALRNQENIDYIFLNGFEIHALNVKHFVRKYKNFRVSPRYLLDQKNYEFNDGQDFRERSAESFRVIQRIKKEIEEKSRIRIIRCEASQGESGKDCGCAADPSDWFYMDFQ